MTMRAWIADVWERVSAVGVAHAAHPDQVRLIRLSNQIALVMACLSLTWTPFLLLLRDPLVWMGVLCSFGYVFSIFVKRSGSHAFGRGFLLFLVDVLTMSYASQQPMEFGVGYLFLANIAVTALLFSMEEKGWLLTMSALPILLYGVSEAVQPDLASFGRVIMERDGEVHPELVSALRIATALTAFTVLAATVMFLRREQGRAEQHLYATIADLERQEEEARRERERAEQKEEEARREREAALQAAAAKANFLATMSHEIRTPMNGVLGMVSLLKDSALGTQQQQMVETIQSSGEMLLAILNDVLDFSKIEAGTLSLEATPFSPATLVSQVLTLMHGRATAKGIELASEGLSSLPSWLQGDPTRVQQVLYNLVGNAIKFTERGRVDVVARFTEGEGLVVEVIDTGVGIPATVLPRLFSAFAQADDSTSRRFGGTGLGLALAGRLVAAMGGEVTVKSAVGVGSCFRVRLPLVVTAAPRVQQARVVGPQGNSRFEGARVLVAEDNPVNVRVITAMLKKLGVVPVVVENGRFALERMTREAWDLVLMDGQMPEMDGYAATAAYRAQEQGERLPIVALTANVMAEDRQRAVEVGMDEVLEKPLQQERLLAVLERYRPAALRSAV